jgi:hypothetical protein
VSIFLYYPLSLYYKLTCFVYEFKFNMSIFSLRGRLFKMYLNVIMQQHCQLSHVYFIAFSTAKLYKHMAFILKIKNFCGGLEIIYSSCSSEPLLRCLLGYVYNMYMEQNLKNNLSVLTCVAIFRSVATKLTAPDT